MADRKLQYIIEMIADDSKLRKQVAKWDWNSIMGSKGKDFGDVLVSDVVGAGKEIKRTLSGINIDWTKILGTKELSQLEQAVTRALSGSRSELEAFAKKGDITGIQNTIKYVSALGDELKALGSNFDAASLARGMGAFMKVLTPLSSRMEQLAKEPAKIEAAFDRLFNGTNVGMTNMAKSSEKVVSAMAKLDAATKDAGGAQKYIDGLSKSFDKLKDMKLPDLSGKSYLQLEEMFDTLEEKYDSLTRKLSKAPNDEKLLLQQAQVIKKMLHINDTLSQNGIESILDSQSVADFKSELDNIVKVFRKEMEETSKDIRKTINEAISEQLGDIKLSISLGDKEKTKFIKEINTFVKQINQTPLEKVKIGVDQILDDSSNVIEDKSKRVHKDSPADDDVNTTKIVAQTENRFDRIADAIENKQGLILTNTAKWRKNMLEQFKFKSGDFEFKFNDTLIDELQALFDEYALKINIDPNHLADQIKTVLANSGGIGGGTANIDANSMAAAVATGLRAALTGENIQVAPISNVDNGITTNVSTATEQVATEIQTSAKHLDLAEDYVKNVVDKLKAVAKYASKDTKGSIATQKEFDRLGIDLRKVKIASDVGNDAEIVSMIENAFLQRDEFGKIKGSTIIDQLSAFRGSSSKTIPAFLTGIDEVFFMLQENTQTVEEWARKRQGKEILDSARATAKAASGLRDVRSSIRRDEIPNIENINNAISMMSAIGKNTDSLQALKSAREALGNKTDDVAIAEFKTAADTFYKSSTKTFWDLKKQAEDTFKGTVYFQGKNGKTHSKYYDNYSKIANIKDDAVIVDVEVHSSLNNVALGEVKSKYSKRSSQAEEKRLMRNSTKPDFIVPREYEEDILNKELKYRGFRAQGITSTSFNAEVVRASVENHKAQAKILQQEINVLDEMLQDSKEKLDGSERTKIASQRDEKITQLQSHLSLAQTNENRLSRNEMEQKYNALQEKSLVLQGSIKKMEEDGAIESALKKKQKELDKVNTKLSETYEKIQSLGGFLSKEGVKEYSDGERKAYAIEELKQIEDDLITAKAQEHVSESRISKKDREIADLDKWGLGAGIGALALAKTKGNLTYEFMNGDYVQSQINTLREKAKKAIAESESQSRRIFDGKVTTAMDHLGWNPLDQVQVKKFLNTNHGQQLSNDFASEVDTNTTNIWKQYDEFRQDLLSKLKTEFQESFKVDKGVLTATSKTQDETGKWVDKIVEIRVKEALKARLETEKQILETKHEPIQANIDRLESDKQTAIAYGGISDKELLSGDIIKDQIRKEEELAKWLERRATIQAELNDLENSGIDKSDETYKEGKRKLKEAEQQVGWYEMLVQNRQKLVQMRYDESKESTYTDEEKKLHFTNQIVSYNQKIEDSLARQKELNKQIATATGDEKTKLQRALSIEEENVVKWQSKIPTYQNKLSRLQAKSQGTSDILTLDGGLFGGLASMVQGALDGANVNIDTEDLAKEVTLKAILSVLSGVGISGNDSSQTIDTKDYENKMARIATLEAKKSTVVETKTSKKMPIGARAEAEALYKMWNVKPAELEFETVKKKAIELKQVIDTLYDEGKTDTLEFVNAQTKLSQLLSGWRSKIGKSSNPEVYGEKGKDVWQSYLTNNIFGDLNNVPLRRISKDNYLSQVKGIYRNSQADTPTTTTNSLTKKERNELKRLRAEVKDYSSTDGSDKNKIQALNGIATEGTLQDILTAIRSGEIKISEVGSSGGATGTTHKKSDDDTSSPKANPAVAKINRYAETIKNAQTDGYLMSDDANATKFKGIVDEINNIVDAIESGTPATNELNARLETLYRNALDVGEVVNKTVNQNKKLYAGSTEMSSVEKQYNNIMGAVNMDGGVGIDLNSGVLQEYINAYDRLGETYQEYVTKRKIHDPDIQNQLKQQASQVKTLGKKASASVAEAQRLQQLVDQSGFYTDKKGVVREYGGRSKEIADTQNLKTAMLEYAKTLGFVNIEHVKYSDSKKQMTFASQVNNDTVAEMTIKYNEATKALYAYNREERESLTGLAGFMQGFKSKLKSITQYMMSITSITDIIRYLRQGVTYIREIDSALTELRKVTSETDEAYKKFLNTASKTANKVGSTIKEVVSSTADFARLGYSMQEAATMAENAQLLMNVSEFDDISSATDTLISAMQAFGYQSSETLKIVDIFNTIEIPVPLS